MVCFRNYLIAAAAAISSITRVTCAPTVPKPPPSVPIAVGGKEAAISIEFIALMLPEYDGKFQRNNQITFALVTNINQWCTSSTTRR